ncbi:FHIPEP family type III secretion protein [Streptomyces sp. NPDC058755]|uniref:FHIPEP family type III secretion protein n=1 Tax=Streptomyces sp. NPDC058755 TaxID=3346624 RepID=UPI0036A14492
MTPNGDVTLFEILLPPAVLARCGPSAEAALTGTLNRLLDRFGLEQTAAVRLGPAENPLGGNLEMHIDGLLCPCSAHDVDRALSYTEGRSLGRSPGRSLADVADNGKTLAALARIVHDTAAVHAGALGRRPTDKVILDLGMNAAFLPIGSPADTSIEASVDDRTGNLIEVRIHPAYLEEIAGENLAEQFRFMAEGLFVELGVRLPAFHCELDTDLDPGSYAFQVNAVGMTPSIGLRPGTVLVNDTVERLRLLEVVGEAALNPATGQPAAVVAAEHRPELEAAGLTTWSPAGYLILDFAAFLRRWTFAVVCRRQVGGALRELSGAFPELTGLLGEQPVTDRLTGLLRDLVRERVSVRDLHRIGHLVLRRPDLDGDDLLAYVRVGLADQIAFTAARSTQTLVVYLLAPEIEETVAEYADAVESDPAARTDLTARLVRAVGAELAHLPATAQMPSLLVFEPSRKLIATLLRGSYPSISVLSHDELPPHFNVQPVARIDWAAE